MSVLVIATSYAPGHNFWAGSQIDWICRGAVMFCGLDLVAIVGAIVLICCSRRYAWGRLSVGIMAYLVIAWLWRSMFSYRDGDMPTAIGFRWGERVLPYILFAAIGFAIWITFKPNRHLRGFDVTPQVK